MPSIFDLLDSGGSGGGGAGMITRPDLPGTTISFQGSAAPRIEPSASQTVAIPVVADWGPVGVDPAGADGLQGGLQLCESFARYTSLFGDSDTPGRTAAAGAFAGQGLPGLPGAGGVRIWRMAGATVAAATHTVNTSAAGTAPTLRIDAKYKGSRGNRISVVTDTDPLVAGNDRLRVYFDGILQETYSYTAPNLAAFVAAANAASQLVRLTALVTDAAPAGALAHIASTPLTGGDDGSSVTSADHLAALAALEFKQFGIIAPYDLTDPAILASYVSWVQSQNANSRPCRLVVGGAAGETLAAAITRSGTIGDEHVINVGCGTYHLDLLDKDLSTSQLAPLVAGILAAKGDEHSLTFSKIGGLHVVAGTPEDQLKQAIAGGVVTFALTSAPDAELRILKGVTTYTGDTATKPADVYSDARLIGIMDDYVRQMKVWGDDTVVGDLPVNEDTRNLVRGQARALQDDLLRRGLILGGDGVTIPRPYVNTIVTDADPTISDTLPYEFGWQFAKTANAIVGQGTVL